MAVGRNFLSFAAAVVFTVHLITKPISCLPLPMTCRADQLAIIIHVATNAMAPQFSNDRSIKLLNLCLEPAGNSLRNRLDEKNYIPQTEGERKPEDREIRLPSMFRQTFSTNSIEAKSTSFSSAFLSKRSEALKGNILPSPQSILKASEIYHSGAVSSPQLIRAPQLEPTNGTPSQRGRSTIDKISIGSVLGALGAALLLSIWSMRRRRHKDRQAKLAAKELERLADAALYDASDLSSSQGNDEALAALPSVINKFPVPGENISFQARLSPLLPRRPRKLTPKSSFPPIQRKVDSATNNSTSERGNSSEKFQHSKPGIVHMSAKRRRQAIKTV